MFPLSLRRLVAVLSLAFPMIAAALPPLLPVEARVREADLVIRGRVIARYPVAISAHADYAFFELEVLEELKGRVGGDGLRPGKPRSVLLVQPLRLGSAAFRKPELQAEYVMFLKAAGSYLFTESTPDGSSGLVPPSKTLIDRVRAARR